jgi:hypothetical protein
VIIQAHSEGGARHQDRRVALDVQECYVALSTGHWVVPGGPGLAASYAASLTWQR